MSHLDRLHTAAREHFGATQLGEPNLEAMWWAQRAAELARTADDAEARVDRIGAELTALRGRYEP